VSQNGNVAPAITSKVGWVTMQLPNNFNAAAYFVDRHIGEGRGAKTAIEYGEERVTYAQLAEAVSRAGNALRRLEIRAEERVAILLLDCPEFAYSFFGAIKMGAVAVPLNTLLKADEYEYLLNDTRAGVLIVSEALLPVVQPVLPKLRRLRHVAVIGGSVPEPYLSFDRLLSEQSADLEAEQTSKDDAAFWLYSSGSTGRPKGCVHLMHDMVVCSERYARATLGMTADDRCFSAAKLFFAYGLGNALYFPLALGATSILWPGSTAPANVLNVISRHKPTLFFSVPSNFAALLAYCDTQGERPDLSSVRYAVSAGEALPAALFHRFKERFGVEILDAIGSTEALHMFIANAPGAVKPGSSGRVIEGYEAKIVDDDDRPVATGGVGNLYIASDATCSHYWNQHEKTKSTIRGKWLHTGDKYRQDEDGYFWYAGRSDDMLKISGMWVSPIEIENTLCEHASVLEAAIVGCTDGEGLLKPKAFVVLRDGTAPGEALAEELKQFVAARSAAYKRPRWVEFVEALPKTATGKTQRFRLRQL
jgi:benzoate-CoA ligase family protein